MKRFYTLVVAATLTLMAGNGFAATKLSVNSIGDLEVSAQDGKTARALVNGTIGEIITADNQTFKISYGKDLKGNRTLIIYPNPAKPQAISVNFLGQDIAITADAVLTIVTSNNNATIRSGFLGSITVGDKELKDGATATIQNGTLAGTTPPLISTPAPKPAPTEEPAKAPTTITEAPPKPVEAPAPAPDSDEADKVYNPHFTAPSATFVSGDVMIAPPGKDVIQVVNESAEPPQLKANTVITPGTTIATGPNSRAVVELFPGTLIGLEPGTTFTFEELSFTPGAPVERKLTGQLKEGTVLSSIKGANPKTTDYKIKTAFGVAAARGTKFMVTFDGKKMVVKTERGVVLVVDLVKNKIEISVPGKKGVIIRRNPDGTFEDPKGWDLSPEELLALQQLFDAVEKRGGQEGPNDPGLRDVIDSFRKTFNPRLNDLPITPTGP